jgi:uncharacterized membrane-anchored protein
VRRANISLVTENGFVIVRSCDLEGAAPDATGQYCFVVEGPDGAEHEVTVEFSREAIALIQRRRRNPLSPESSFWLACAERSLATYLWETDQLPSQGTLLIEEVCLRDLEVARRWDSD